MLSSYITSPAASQPPILPPCWENSLSSGTGGDCSPKQQLQSQQPCSPLPGLGNNRNTQKIWTLEALLFPCVSYPDFLTPPNPCWPFVISAYPTSANLRKRTEKVIHAEKQVADKISGLFIQRTRGCLGNGFASCWPTCMTSSRHWSHDG